MLYHITCRCVLLMTISMLCMVNSESHQNNKRAPLGFTGVRGKKSIPDSEYATSGERGNAAEKRAPSGFMGVRGKKPFQLWGGTYPAEEEEVFKRAPSGFMGMRGKKDMESNNNYGFQDEFNKRAPSGFMGMRGKKPNIQNLQFPLDDGFYDKRAPMGFVGMRGKKDFDEDPEEAKRAPSGFFGMRGKKMRQSGFFGMRGKKYPYEFRGKFVGVRGKKLDEELKSLPDLDINQLMLLLTENRSDPSGDLWNEDNNEIGTANEGNFRPN